MANSCWWSPLMRWAIALAILAMCIYIWVTEPF
jgi:hypothetical protein